MKTVNVLALLALGVSKVIAEGVTSAIAPQATAPAGCHASYPGNFEITVVKVTAGAKRDVNPIAKRSKCSGDGILVSTLDGGILSDAKGRVGYIASNFQFQFDQPPQAGAIYTAGFSACGNGSLALGGKAVWYECASGDFYNLYDRSWAEQCEPVEIILMECGDSAEPGDGQVVGTKIVTTTIVSALADGQPQVRTTTTGVPVCEVSQVSDGQVQVATTPCASITTTAAATSTAAPVSQYSDGQIQVTPPASVPTVTSAPATETTPKPAAGTTPAGSESGSFISVPTETLPSSGVVSAPPSGSASEVSSAPSSVSGGSSASGTASSPGVVSSGTSGTTLATSATGTSTEASGTASASGPTGTSAPARNDAAVVQMGSLGALFVCFIGAVAVL